MKFRTRLLGYNITLNKPSECPLCNKKGDLDFLERVVDTTNGVLRYVMVLKCPSCSEISFAKYVIGEESRLKDIEVSSDESPIEGIVVSE